MKRHGVDDSYEKARQYFDAVATYHGPASSPARREAFLRTGPEMVEFLERHGMAFEYADGWSDYYDNLPGGQPRGRSLVAKLFDLNELGRMGGEALAICRHLDAGELERVSRAHAGEAHMGRQEEGGAGGPGACSIRS